MAKGLRSKSMRKNRSYLRKTLVEPVSRQRQEKIAERMRTVKEAQQPKTLTALRNLITVAVPQGHSTRTADAMEEVEEEEEEEEQQQPQKKRGGGANPDITKVVRGGRTIEVMASKTKSGSKKK